jgi:hypothetical protein
LTGRTENITPQNSSQNKIRYVKQHLMNLPGIDALPVAKVLEVLGDSPGITA